jgi:hypothetical protein
MPTRAKAHVDKRAIVQYRPFPQNRECGKFITNRILMEEKAAPTRGERQMRLRELRKECATLSRGSPWMQRNLAARCILVFISCAASTFHTGLASDRLVASAQVTASGTRSSDPGTERAEGNVRVERPKMIPTLIEAIRKIVATDSVAEQDGNTIRFVGNTREAGLAEWLASELTDPIPSPVAVGHEYIMPNDDNDVILVIRDIHVGAPASINAPHLARLEELQEVTKALRILCDLRVAEFSPTHALIWRGAPRQSQFAGFLLGEFGNPPASDWQEPTSYELESVSQSAVRLFYFPQTFRSEELEKLANAVRAKTRTDRVAALSCVRAIVLRGTDKQAATAQKLVDKTRRHIK